VELFLAPMELGVQRVTIQINCKLVVVGDKGTLLLTRLLGCSGIMLASSKILIEVQLVLLALLK
jgi:hypothetical protein